MPSYDAYGKDAPPVPYACRVVDAMGAEIPHCVFVNTECGLVVRLVTDERGNFLVDENQEIRRKVETRPAPIELVPV